MTELSLFSIPHDVFLEMVLESPAFRVFVFKRIENLDRNALNRLYRIEGT